MPYRLSLVLIGIACVTLLLGSAAAAPIPAACNASFTVCAIPENTLFLLPGLAIAGDVVLTEPGSTTVSDVFRIFNDILNTGSGTGLGETVFLYSADDEALPPPSTYSANVQFLSEDPSGVTSFFGNGTNYLLGAPEPRTFQLVLAAAVLMALRSRRRFRWILVGIAASCCSVAFAQQTVNLADGPVSVTVTFDLPPGTGPAQEQSRLIAAAPGLAFYTANYTALGGVQLPFHIVGTDPSLGPNTTTIPTVLVPLKFVFPNAGSPTLDGTNVVATTQNSPMFLTADYTAGAVDLGVTQYGDALQRGQFWNLPGFSPNYHVLLGAPSVASTVTVTLPTGAGNAYALSGGGFLGVVDTTYFGQILNTLLPNYTANQLPIFLTDNVFLGTNGLIQNCCIFGYHESQGPPINTAKTWIYAAYAEPGTFSGTFIMDVVPLSHEVAEWLNDPFVGAFSSLNFIPPAVLPGQGGACIINFETGDPIEALSPSTFTKTTNGTTYHLQDEVFLTWYLHSVPSFSVSGWYTFQNVTATIPLVVNSPPGIAGSYTNTAQLDFAPVDTAVTADVVYVGRGCPAGSISPGSPADPYLADPSGKIALIDRGACAVSLKIDAAANAGAVGVLIGLVAPGNAVSFTYAGGSNFVPSLVITQDTSNAIKGALGSSPVNATISPNNAIPPPFSTLCGPG
jgi:hypothetical protein